MKPRSGPSKQYITESLGTKSLDWFGNDIVGLTNACSRLTRESFAELGLASEANFAEGVSRHKLWQRLISDVGAIVRKSY
jgi:hypothetical protein